MVTDKYIGEWIQKRIYYFDVRVSAFSIWKDVDNFRLRAPLELSHDGNTIFICYFKVYHYTIIFLY